MAMAVGMNQLLEEVVVNSAMKKEPPSTKGSAPRSTSVAVDKKASKKVAIDRAKSR